MFDFNPRQRIMLILMAIFLLGGIGWGVRKGSQPPPITFVPGGTALASSPSGTKDSLPPRLGGASPKSEGNAAAPLMVHVAGAVKTPGVYTLQPGQRVVDALHKAGGPSSSADLDALNLAAKVTDGQQILVPRKGRSIEESASGAAYSSASSASSASNDSVSSSRSSRRAAGGHASGRGRKPPPSMVAVNSASLEQLETLPGVGPSTAQKILDYRTQTGPFQTPDDLLNVKGIGPKKLEKMRQYVIAP